MAASYETVQAVIAVMREHVTPEQLRAIARDLRKVPGNASFRETTRRLAKEIEDGRR